MSCFLKRTVKDKTYICCSSSFRNENGKPDNKKEVIGKIDYLFNRIILNKKYLAYLNNKNIDIENFINDLECHFGIKKTLPFANNQQNILLDNNISSCNIDEADNNDKLEFSLNDVSECKVINFGSTYLLDQLCKKIGLYNILISIFNQNANQILGLIYYLVSTGLPLMYCEEWAENNLDNIPSKIMDSQSLSILLQRITETNKSIFFDKWLDLRQENEYIALDITSISSFSDLMEDVDWGKNKEDDKLPQINLCLLFGETSGLPIYCTHYSGSITDVVTLKSTLEQISFLNNRNFKLVMDKGFYSKNNIDYLVKNLPTYKFLISVPLKETYKEFFDNFGNDITEDKYNLLCMDMIIHGKLCKLKWDNYKFLNAYLYYNPQVYLDSKNKLYTTLHTLKRQYELNINNYYNDDTYKNFFIVSKRKNFNNTGKYTIQINHNTVKNSLKHVGRLVILGNDNLNVNEALEIYRSKDVVEKGFKKFKSSLDLRRIRVHDCIQLSNKEFICFLSQIILSYFDKLMSDNHLYKNYSLLKVINKFKSLKLKVIKGKYVLNHLSKFQKDILNTFNIGFPTSNSKLLK
ncbi:MAG: transposase [Deltaproteobacteria bacterium]|jgi:transposase|nr:transposase [Deltaproteobacteria bacterium]